MASSTPTTTFFANFSSSTSILSRHSTTRHYVVPSFFPETVNKSIFVRASKSQSDKQADSNTKTVSDNAFISKEDVSYLVKLGAGSVAGAAAIKYGSIVFPEITKPDIGQALTMIIAPVIVTVLLLIKQSSSK